MVGEFDIIDRFFKKRPRRKDVILSVGDDCAILDVPLQKQLVVTMDTLVLGTHFFSDIPAKALGYKSLAVNLSDLAAMGADPAWVMMSLVLPKCDELWLHEFSSGFFELADRYGLDLVGGNIARGPLSITIEAHGFLPKGQALTRSGAKPGDWVVVSGLLGASAAALAVREKRLLVNDEIAARWFSNWYYPKPEIELGSSLLGMANAAIDLSDGLLADLGHMAQASSVGMLLDPALIPVDDDLLRVLSREEALSYALTGGEDYCLAFTISPERFHELSQRASLVVIGEVTSGEGVSLLSNNQTQAFNSVTGFKHF